MEFKAEGVIPATLVAFETDFEIDVAASRKHLRDVADVAGLSAITVNGHASEIHAFSFAEQQQLLAESLDEVGDALPLVNGVYADGSHAAVAVAKMAAGEGAGCIIGVSAKQHEHGWPASSRYGDCPFQNDCRCNRFAADLCFNIRQAPALAIRLKRCCKFLPKCQASLRSRIGAMIRCCMNVT